MAIVDVSSPDAARTIDHACRTVGFFALAGHGIDGSHRDRLIAASRALFALPDDAKRRVALSTGASAWRGWFPFEGELTSGVPDLKEGFYVGRELPPDPRPLHGPNRWPDEVPALRREVSAWMEAMEVLGQRVLASMAVGLGLDREWFARTLTADPTVLFRIFRYPPHPPAGESRWGVAEHSDYGLLTLLAHDGTPGLEVKVGDEWVPAPSDPELIICNIGDMLDRLTAGRYRSTPHRVRNIAGHDRISLPFFLDPSWDAVIEPLPLDDGWTAPPSNERWDRANLEDFGGTYGEWLVGKVSKVFPDLARTVL
jgi:isopenicillin N synthase-like dioxygenase